MPPFYEDAAHILLFLTRKGLILQPGVDCRVVIAHLAACLKGPESHGLSHIAAAAMILAELEKRDFVSCDAKRRTRLLKVLGTALANFQCTHKGLHC